MGDEVGELQELARLTSSGEAIHEGDEGTIHECGAVISHDFSFPPSKVYQHFYRHCPQVFVEETRLKRVHEDLMLPKTGPKVLPTSVVSSNSCQSSSNCW